MFLFENDRKKVNDFVFSNLKINIFIIFLKSKKINIFSLHIYMQVELQGIIILFDIAVKKF